VSTPSPASAANTNHVLVLVNPKAGRTTVAHQVDRLVELLRRRGFVVEASADLVAICRQANQAHREGRLRALVGVGGDGTAAELVNQTDPGLPITLYPAGTRNLIAGYLGLRPSPEQICDTVASGTLLRLDAGVAAGRVFQIMASCGFDADVVLEVHRARDTHAGGHLSYWSYLKPILQAIRNYQYPEMRVYWDDASDGRTESWHGPISARWVFVFNLPRYGWGLPLAHWADGTDGLLDLCTFRRGSFWHGLRYLVMSQMGAHRCLRDCTVARARRLRIVSDEPVRCQLDGDPGGWLPLEIEVLPGRLTFVVPGSNGGRRSPADRI